jgi:hypothetical protein
MSLIVSATIKVPTKEVVTPKTPSELQSKKAGLLSEFVKMQEKHALFL